MSGRPFILWKCAASLDGRIAAADGSSKWITSAEARADGHRLRAECGAVMVGSGTQQADDPQLAVRDAEATRQPLRIVVDSNARTPASARVLDDAAPTLIAVADDADASHLEGRADILRLPRVAAGLDLELLLLLPLSPLSLLSLPQAATGTASARAAAPSTSCFLPLNFTCFLLV